MILPSKVIIKNKTEKKLLELKHVFVALIVVMSSWVCTNLKPHQIIYIQYSKFCTSLIFRRNKNSQDKTWSEKVTT